MSKAKLTPLIRMLSSAALSAAVLLAPLARPARAQDPVTGAFAGDVTVAGERTRPIVGARVEIVNVETGAKYPVYTNASGSFYVGKLSPGDYDITVSAPGYRTRRTRQRLNISQNNEVQPVPVELFPDAPAPSTPAPMPTPATPAAPAIPTGPTPTATQPTPEPYTEPGDDEPRINLETNRVDGRRGGSFDERRVSTLPLGSTTLIRTFDELALLLPGVFPPPFTLGNIAGPGVGPGVGSAGQFSSNGMPPRANNFTVDGSDNNDEDIGVRRQGFFSLVPQPIESIREYQIISLLAPAQFGRNIGAQVNAVSKSGGSDYHGSLYGFFNTSQLNARNFFDTAGADGNFPLTSRTGQAVTLGGVPRTVSRGFGDEDSFTLGQFGATFGGPLRGDRWFFFFSGEGQVLNASQEKSFAVPTIEERGLFNSGASGVTTNPLNPGQGFVAVRPQTRFGAAIFSLFPFANNPDGVYGPNTFTQVLPAGGRGGVGSGKIDYVNPSGRLIQSFTTRYNFTDDERDIPAAGGAIFATIRPYVRTQNLSTYFNSQLSDPGSSNPVYNQLRLSYGRTRLKFEELSDRSHLVGSPFGSFLLNAPLIENTTVASGANSPNTGAVTFAALTAAPPGGCVRGTLAGTTECFTGPVGQVIIGGFSPVGVDPFNFPQRRVNNTYQLADTMSIRRSGRLATTYTFGTDLRRTELNSDLPRNARPQITFSGALPFQNRPFDPNCRGLCEVAAAGFPFLPATTLVAAGVPSGFFQSLAAPGNESANIGLRYYQLNFFGQEEVRLSPSLSLSLGVRYEYNTPAREINGRIEQTLGGDVLVDPTGGLLSGRGAQIYRPDRDNFAPRVGIAWSPDLFGPDRPTVIRGGFGVFYDQIIGAVVSQSRNVPPTFTSINLASLRGDGTTPFNPLLPQSPQLLRFGSIPSTGESCISPLRAGCTSDGPFIITGLNTLNPIFTQNATLYGALINAFRAVIGSPVSFTLPRENLEMPMAYHYSYTVEQGLPNNMLLSLAYAGTTGRNLLRFTTPNNGPSVFPIIGGFGTAAGLGLPNAATCPNCLGITGTVNLPPTRPLSGLVGPISFFESTGRSQYDSLQVQLRGRASSARPFLYQIGYTYSRSRDNVSDVFDLAGSPALPQQSAVGLQPVSDGRFPGEYGRSNFDAPHRVSYDFVWDIVPGKDGLQLTSLGQFQSGQPFTVNSIIDVNNDGNLTDRLNTLAGINFTGTDRQPIQLGTANARSLLAGALGFSGGVRRNTFRAGTFRLVNLSVIKKFGFTETQNLSARVDIFNLLNRDNFNIPVRFLEAPGFGSATETVTPGRRIQLGLKLTF